MVSDLIRVARQSWTKPSDNLFEVIKLKYVTAEDTAKEVSEIFNGPPPQAQQGGGQGGEVAGGGGGGNRGGGGGGNRGGFGGGGQFGGAAAACAGVATPTPGRVRSGGREVQ